MPTRPPEHHPHGDDPDKCTRPGCGKPHSKHKPKVRSEHKPEGDNLEACTRCGRPHKHHRNRKRKRPDNRRPIDRWNYIGIDGEGQDDQIPDDWRAEGFTRGFHRYKMLAASNADASETWVVEAKPGEGLSTVQCLDMILSLPKRRTRVFAYSFNYDLTMMLKDLDDESLYYLFRPELRQRKKHPELGPWPVRWPDKQKGPYFLNLQGTKFTVKNADTKDMVTVWDLFRFFGCKFVSALKDWKVGSEDLLERMSHMKDKRKDFDKEDPIAVRAYCLEECACIAELGEKLILAHDAGGLQLKNFYGAGSSGAAMLNTMEIIEKNAVVPPELVIPAASAFFGGRFENSCIGEVKGMVHGYDISSAYPYQIYRLPCLQHGTWSHTTNRGDISPRTCTTAVVRYSLPEHPRHKIEHWGPFPFRTEDGSICYPSTSPGGWVWQEEFLAGEDYAPHNVRFHEAWIYKTECDCHPFGKIAEYYALRLQLGKEGAGIVLKLGCNSCYGKLAQSIGNAPFNNWIWAGIITAGCRAQLLRLLMLHKNRGNALMMATDGLYSKEALQLPVPIPTGTGMVVGGKSKPLGGWEEKLYPQGVFVARPGIYFPLNPTKEDIKEIRARGVGKGVVLEYSRDIVESWREHGMHKLVTLPSVNRFCGAKTSISRSNLLQAKHDKDPSKIVYTRANGRAGKPSYGQWIERKIEMSFDPMPKRDGVDNDGRSLKLRRIRGKKISAAYGKALPKKGFRNAGVPIAWNLSDEAREMIGALMEAMEQPDHDFADMDTWEDA